MIQYGTAPFIECSSRGEKRLSPVYARIIRRNNRSIAELLQASKVYAGGVAGLSAREGAGRRITNWKALERLHQTLWEEYLDENPDLRAVIQGAAGVSNELGKEGVRCHAHELWAIHQKLISKRAPRQKAARLFSIWQITSWDESTTTLVAKPSKPVEHQNQHEQIINRVLATSDKEALQKHTEESAQAKAPD